MVHDHQSGAGSVAQVQQRLAQGRHGARIVFILIVSGVERVEDDDLGSGSLGSGEEVIRSLGCAEQMAGSAGVDQKVEIRGASNSSPHDREAADKLRDGEFELADQDASRSRDGKPGAVRAGGQG
jgi:hypothetical protein